MFRGHQNIVILPSLQTQASLQTFLEQSETLFCTGVRGDQAWDGRSMCRVTLASGVSGC